MKLNLPEYNFRIRRDENQKDEIFDEFRKRFIVLTPEEWVRQNFLRFLRDEKNYPGSLIAIEKGITVNTMKKRFDAVVFNKAGNPEVLIEFKAPGIKLDQKVMEQISRYNLSLNVRYLIVSNGLTHYCCIVDKKTNSISFLKEIPDYNNLEMHSF